MLGRRVGRVDFLSRFRLLPIGVNRRGRSLREDLDKITLEQSDTLLMLGTSEAVDQVQESGDLILIDRPTLTMPGRRRKLPLILAVMAGVVGAASTHLMPIAPAAIIGCVVLLLTKCITPRGAYESIHWPILFLIFGMLGVGAAMEHVGANHYIADQLASAAGQWVPEDLRPLAMLAAIYLIATVLTEILTNNAAAILLTSLAIRFAEFSDLNPRPFLIAVAIAASASFATPIGYQTNTYIYGFGNYRFADFCKIGIPLNLIGFALSMALIPLFWSFER